MGAIAYYFVYAILWSISILPFPILYFLSDCIYFLLYKVIGYRKKTVRYNLKITLPHLSDEERLKIEQNFYHHLCDMFLEMAKTLTISEDEMKKRYRFTNLEVVKEFEKKNKSIILMTPHYASWEWVIILGKFIDFKGFGIYKKLSNPRFDKLVRDMRSKFDAELISTKETVKKIKENQSINIHGIYLFLSDQTPNLRKGLQWEYFLGHEVPVHMGAENLARELDMNVLYLKVSKVKRGFYEAKFIPITDCVLEEKDFEITKRFLKLSEEQILEKPDYYFWTHKRWKHMGRKNEVE
ncbi:lipid A biosynthesis acyltransferase [Paenimyroides tangerinum]|uniref:Lipid A biosynthesis acyltransferase n=1 Tax=Paenimyroides tangerinum TaxID=2488728 RepID=A0A3P3WFF6_9FLAO|nr:lysophospholipid acyltransferase family protein [Paenimyroides tangerinum]RRJ91283.1 lipid A biosynthesis acyltransferase [Paenimyroides tangerinum]